jgi:hypothetical protein
LDNFLMGEHSTMSLVQLLALTSAAVRTRTRMEANSLMASIEAKTVKKLVVGRVGFATFGAVW